MSCDSATLARDLKVLAALYYHYDYAQPWLPQLEANLHGLKADWAKLTAYQQKQNMRSK